MYFLLCHTAYTNGSWTKCHTAQPVDPSFYEQEPILEFAFANHMLTCWRKSLKLQGKQYVTKIAEFLLSIHKLEEINVLAGRDVDRKSISTT